MYMSDQVEGAVSSISETTNAASGILNETTSVSETATQVIQQPTEQLPGWYSDIKDDSLRGYAEARGFGSTEELVSAYKQLDELGLAEKAGKTLMLPSEDDAEGYNNLYKALGRPDSPDGYNLVPEGQQPTEFTSAMAKLMHEHGLTQKQAQGLAQHYNEMASNLQAESLKQFEVESTNQMEALKKEWGTNYGHNVEMFKRGVKGLGVSTDEFSTIEQALGTKRAVEIFKNAASAMSEAQFRASNDSNPNFMSPDAAKVELDRLSNDKEFGKRISSNDANAMDKWERLNRLAMG
jgi:hypothetical protein